jgi:opacity protein-like surface antigen
MNSKLTAALALAMAGSLATAAYAQEPSETSGFYLGGGIGQFNAQIDDVDQIDNTVDKWKADGTAYKIFAGYRLNPYLGFEVDYVNLGSASGQVVPGNSLESKVDGFAPYAVGTIPLGKYVELYGRAGYYFYNANRSFTDTLDNRVSFKEDSESFVYGGGIGANFGEKFNVRAEYERFDIKNLDGADALWLTAGWRF